MECKNYHNCTNKTKHGLSFCDDCLTGLLEHELNIDDIVEGLENAIYPIWDRMKNNKEEA